MNRAMKRQLDRDARRHIDRSERVVCLPRLLDEFTIFDIPQTILERIKTGYIESANNMPIFRDNEGEWSAVCPSLSGWVFTWQRISDQMKLALDLEPMRRINRRLEFNTPITESQINSALQALENTRTAFRNSDRKKIAEIARTAQIILLNSTEATAA